MGRKEGLAWATLVLQVEEGLRALKSEGAIRDYRAGVDGHYFQVEFVEGPDVYIFTFDAVLGQESGYSLKEKVFTTPSGEQSTPIHQMLKSMVESMKKTCQERAIERSKELGNILSTQWGPV